VALDLIKQGGGGSAEIILLADAAGDDATAAAARAHAAGVRVSVVAFGTAQGAPVPLPQGGFLKSASGEIVLPKLDAPALSALADAGGGRYVDDLSDARNLDALLDLPVARDGASQTSEATTARFLDRGPWLLLLLVPLAAAGFRRGWLMLALLGVFACNRPAEAFSWADLWQRADQQARQQLDAGNAQQAQALAKAPELRGAAAYRAGDFAAAERAFSSTESAESQYNRGNALAKQGQYEQAIAAYDDALKRAPDLADAAANKSAIEQWLKQQQQNSDDSRKDAKDHQGHDQQQDGKGSPSSQQSDQQDQQQGQQAKDAQAQDSQQQQQQASKGEHSDQQQAADAKQPGDEAEQQAQQKFSEKMSKAMQENAKEGDKKPQPMRLGANEGGKQQDEHDQAVQQWIERVPDDPGGLLRRKFQIEYQRRQNHGDPRGGDR